MPSRNLSTYLRRRYYRFPSYGPAYDAGSEKRAYSSWFSPRVDAKGELLTIQKIRDRSRDLFRNDTIGSAAIKKLVRSALGGGLKFKSVIDVERLKISDKKAKALISEIEERFSEWCQCQICDYRMSLDFFELQELIAFSHLISGDGFFLLPITKDSQENFNLQVNVIDSERIDTPTEMEETEQLSYGVQTDYSGRILGYYLSDRHPHATFEQWGQDTFQYLPKYGRESGRQMIGHVYTSHRPESLRGVPFLSPVVGKIKQLGRFTEAEIAGAVISSYVVASIQRGSNTELGGGVPGLNQNESEPEILNMGEGLVFESFDDSQWNVHASPRPNENFESFVRAISQQIGASLEIPYEVLLNTFNSSYSASRAALLEAYRFFDSYATKIKSKVCNPIFSQWLELEVQKGNLKLKNFDDSLMRRAWSRCEWYGASPGSIDPLKEAKAAVERVKLGISTRSRESALQTNSDFRSNADQLEKENEIMRKYLTNQDNKLNGNDRQEETDEKENNTAV